MNKLLKEYIQFIKENDDNFTVMYHGGRFLESSYNEILGNKNKQMEYGPGLYLTNYFTTAQKYAKGGGSIYKVYLKLNNNSIDNVILTLDNVFNFIKNTRLLNKKELVNYIKNKYSNDIKANNFLNLLISFDCLAASNSLTVRKFLIENNIDYLISKNYGGFNDQYIIVVFNPKIIKKVEKVSTKNVDVKDYILHNDF
jgi:hypothetical protein